MDPFLRRIPGELDQGEPSTCCLHPPDGFGNFDLHGIEDCLRSIAEMDHLSMICP